MPAINCATSRPFHGLGRVTAMMDGAFMGALTGTALVVAAPTPTAASGRLVGASLALGAGASYAIVTVCARSVADRYSPLQPFAISFTIGTGMLVLLVLDHGLVITYPLVGWLLLYIGLIPIPLGYGLYMWGLRTTPATVAAILTLLEPLISTLLAVVLLNESLAPASLLGAVILVGSIVVLYRHTER